VGQDVGKRKDDGREGRVVTNGRLRCLLIGGRGGGGEEVFLRDLDAHPPAHVEYSLVLDHHQSIPGASARWMQEVAFNRLIQPWIWPLSGLRSYRVDARFDIVHVHNHLNRIHAARGVPVVMTLGGGSYVHYVREYLGWDERSVQRLYARARRVLPPLGIANEFVSWRSLAGIGVRSQFARQQVVEMGVPEELIDVLPPGFPGPDAPPAKQASEEFRFLFVGRDAHRKGADLAIAAFRTLVAQGVRARLVLVGDPSFRALVGERGFEVHEWLDRATLFASIYPGADALLLPARSEGFGFVAVEAMGFGLPVIGSNQGALPEILAAGECGVLVPPNDAHALARAMETLARDPSAARDLGSKARRRFESEYTRARFAERLSAFYARALSRAR
jgi:glycosyltransferase involved in cell wall biosynthesis